VRARGSAGLVDKPIGDAITDEAAKAVRIIKGLDIKK
jgi:hypothetical protein